MEKAGLLPSYVGPGVGVGVTQIPASAPKMSAEVCRALDELGRRIDLAGTQPMDASKFDTLHEEIRRLEERVSSRSGGGSKDTQDQIDALVTKILDMESRVMDESVVVGEYSFGSFADIKK
jgi:hypothetical protein